MARLSFPSRVILVLLLAVVLASPVVLGAQLRPRVEARQDAFLTALVSKLRVQIWRLLNGWWEKNGCIADPNGGSVCSNGSTVVGTDQGDNGCGLDPHGGCEY